MTKPPVCVLGLGLIGGSVMRAAAEAGREVFGYNRSIEGVQAATADGFDATENIDEALTRAADDRRADRAGRAGARAADRARSTSAISRRTAR